jgi:hypothetical protein
METTTTQTTETQKKITLATVKSFMRKNADNLWTKTMTSFDGMIDCVSKAETDWKRTSPEVLEKGLVGSRGARDYYRPYQNGAWKGIEVTNCCGCWMLATNIE